MSQVNYANRGMGLEELVEHANEQYLVRCMATIQKVATPWTVVRKGKQIVSAFPKKKSTVDFIGVYKGLSIAFDAKSTQNKTSFPLSNVEEHQVHFMASWELTGGKGFFLIEFSTFGEIYFMPYSYFLQRWNLGNAGIEKKSIPYEWIKQFPRVKQGNGIVLDYLTHIEITEVEK